MYVLRACVEQESIVCEEITIGKEELYYYESESELFLPIGFKDLTPYELNLGDEKRILIENPYENAFALVSYGTVDDYQDDVFPLAKGRSIFTLKVDALCEFGCGLSIAVSVPRQTQPVVRNATNIPFGPFDLNLPHTTTYNGQISVKPSAASEIPISIEFPQVIVEDNVASVTPGERTTVEVKLGINQKAEVAIFVVDASSLRLVPYEIIDLSDEFRLSLKTDFEFTKSSDYIIPPAATQALIDIFETQRRLNPWFDVAAFLPDYYKYDLDEKKIISSERKYITDSFSTFPSNDLSSTNFSHFFSSYRRHFF